MAPATMNGPRTRVALDGVAETLLWTLYHRAMEARRPDAVLDDPMAVELLDGIDYPFERRFGKAHMGSAQGQALRARTFDERIRAFLDEHPEATVVALGEGLETQFWRVDNGRLTWLSVDLPDIVELRRKLLPAEPRVRHVACSALDDRWMDEVDASRGVVVTAQGLLMYLKPAEVRLLIARCAERFPGGELVLDAVPRWFSAQTVKGRMKTREGYVAPPMPWGMDASERWKLHGAHPNIVEIRDLALAPGRGFFYTRVAPHAHLIPVVRNRRPSITVVRFGPGAATDTPKAGPEAESGVDGTD
ncbi:class I SAM-dependent methyltransferase [Yinghuangia seranimata]|uniref:class I SAM-dependent methyltransferase n=1 Tax=Yinghuangia seranimata TaxID=408067 RepID=UPI00248B441D|nr:class I SAM-dependent methyltransferase [Yinghuangia seranimata]MDI2131040.1 class I SAM-dependent methyltransferase [Yinghuangia seranimata]